MPRENRNILSEQEGSIHLISRVVGRQWLLKKNQKNYLLNLIKKLSQGFFIHIHAFIIMSNHLHILATEKSANAKKASKEELIQRYKLIYGENKEPPQGSIKNNIFFPDKDGGIERLRTRLGSISRFMQELKQNFSSWYNKNNKRKGYFWADRYKSINVYKGAPQFETSVYIDLNSIRAKIVLIPEEYPWSSLAEHIRNPQEASLWLFPFTFMDVLKYSEGFLNLPTLTVTQELITTEWYREFCYAAGAVKRKHPSILNELELKKVLKYCSALGVLERFNERIRNFSEGIAVGGPVCIHDLQIQLNRKHIKPRNFLNTNWTYSTRVLRI